MYKAVIDLRKYNEKTRQDLYKEYPDYPEAKQANVAVFYMLKLPSPDYLQSEMKRILDKYGKGFWRNDQSLWNLLFYYNHTDLGFSGFNWPPEDKLFYPPDEYFAFVHTGHYEAMYLPTGKYHVLHQYWLYRLLHLCPK